MKLCSIDGCNEKHEGLGYCKKHYRRFKKYGDPLATPIRKEGASRKSRTSYEDNHTIIDGIEFKLCGECKEFYPMNNDYFYKNNSNKVDGFNTYCIVCTFERAKRWVENNPKKYKEQKLRKVANKTDIQRQRSRDAAKKNRDEGYTKQWQHDNKDKLREYQKKRQSNKKHEINRNEWENCKTYFNYSCAYCGIEEIKAKEKYKNKLHKEHVNHNGANDLSNCVPACKMCNGSKWTYDFEEWYKNQEFFTEERLLKINKWLLEDFKTYITPKKNIKN